MLSFALQRVWRGHCNIHLGFGVSFSISFRENFGISFSAVGIDFKNALASSDSSELATKRTRNALVSCDICAFAVFAEDSILVYATLRNSVRLSLTAFSPRSDQYR